jgi:hypothetical protein
MRGVAVVASDRIEDFPVGAAAAKKLDTVILEEETALRSLVFSLRRDLPGLERPEFEGGQMLVGTDHGAHDGGGHVMSAQRMPLRPRRDLVDLDAGRNGGEGERFDGQPRGFHALTPDCSRTARARLSFSFQMGIPFSDLGLRKRWEPRVFQ